MKNLDYERGDPDTSEQVDECNENRVKKYLERNNK